MPQQAWSKKRERQYQHIKEGLEERGRDEDKAEEIAARTVNKERARAGSPSGQPDVHRRHLVVTTRGAALASWPGGRTKAQLYQEARDKNIKGRSSMTKAELERAVGR